MLKPLHYQSSQDEDLKQRKQMSRRIERVLPPALDHVSKEWREMRQTYNSARAADSDALFAKPALGRFAAALQDDRVALQASGDVVPGGCDELVFAAEILDFLLEFDLGMC
jgi:hypothetical protein